jgi:hypothetical protein
MQGFGKLAVLFMDTKIGLPSDFVRTFSVFYDQPDYLRKFDELLTKLTALPKYYSDMLADTALDVGDYEKAAKYYQDAFLFSGNSKHLSELQDVKNRLKSNEVDFHGFSRRLTEQIDVFLKAKLFDSRSKRPKKLETGQRSKQKADFAARPPGEPDDLLIHFLAKYPKTAFSPWRIQTWGSQREGFNRLAQYSKVAIRQSLDRLLAGGKLETALSRKGNTLYKLVTEHKNDSENDAIGEDE